MSDDGVTTMAHGTAYLISCRLCDWRYWAVSRLIAAERADLHDGDHYGDTAHAGHDQVVARGEARTASLGSVTMDTNQQDDLRIAMEAIDGLFAEGDCTCRYCLARAVVLALHGEPMTRCECPCHAEEGEGRLPPGHRPCPAQPPTEDDWDRMWGAFDALMRRCSELEELADRLAGACTDEEAVGRFRAWKRGPG